MDARLAARLLAAGRLGFGVALFAAPATAGRLWFGQTPGVAGKTALRGLGARDVAIGVGTLLAADEGGHLEPWLDASVVADVADSVAIILARNELDPKPVVGTVMVAGAAALVGLWAKSQLAD